MTLLKCATLVVNDLAATIERYAQWMDYHVIEMGAIASDLAEAWHTPASAGRAYAVMQPASGTEVFLRFVEGDPVPEYQPIRTYGWAATELCVTDVDAVNDRMLQSPFEVIGPPRQLDGYATIKPMQVRGPDKEVVYLTEFTGDDPALILPKPQSFIDRPFIIVHASKDIAQSITWLRDVLGLAAIEPVAIRYTMIAKAFDLPPEEKSLITTAQWPGGETFLEFDQYPAAASERKRHPGELPPGVALVSMLHHNIEHLDGQWLSPPAPHQGVIYGGRKVGVMLTPDGALLEVIDAN